MEEGKRLFQYHFRRAAGHQERIGALAGAVNDLYDRQEQIAANQQRIMEELGMMPKPAGPDGDTGGEAGGA